MAKDDTSAGDGTALGELRDGSRRDRGKHGRRMKYDDPGISETSGSEDARSSSRRKRERESEGGSERKKRDRVERMSGDGSSKRKRGSRRRDGPGTDSEEDDSHSSSSSGSETGSGSESGTGTESEGGSGRSEASEGEARRRRRKERRRREEKERRRKKEKERERRRRDKEKEKEKKRKRGKEKKEKKRKKREKKDKDLGKTGAVTNKWGKYGIIREVDMWNKRPEFTAWLAEVKQVNLESLSNWEEKQMFKEFMEDHNTATFPSKKYYNLDAYHRHKMSKQIKKGLKEAPKTERTVFDDEEQRRQELLKEREKMKEEQVETLKRSMQSGMAQAMKEQALLREEMQLQYKLGNFEAAAAIQRRLDPDVAM